MNSYVTGPVIKALREKNKKVTRMAYEMVKGGKTK